ncbi:ankyrin repeat-containing domain protein [Terfezia claveryi]|nr:ankyrin repeat-containing domain protein [Terfezia claveryi]
MSLGFGIGDIIAVSRLALDVYSAYKDAPEDFRNISHEIKSLHIIVDKHKDEFRDKILNLDEERQLREILQGCTNVLEDLDKLRIKYMSLGSAQGSSAQAIDRIKWGQENIVELRARLTSNTTLLNTFIISRTHAMVVTGQAELLSSIEEIKNHFLAGLRRKNSTMSLQSNSSFAPSVKTKEAMKRLCKNLYKAGVRADMIRDREDQAAAFFQSQNTPPVVVPQIASSEVQKEEPLEENEKGKNKRITTRRRLLNMAAATGFRQGIQLLLWNVENTETVLNAFKISPLDIAAGAGRTEVVRLLLEKGANIETTRSSDGSTALDTAAYFGHAGVVRLLLEKGANIEATRSSDGSTALQTAAYSGHADV